MKKYIREILSKQSGQVLPVVLALMVVGALIALPSLSFVTTSLKAGETIEENVQAMYAADAGIEDAVWKLGHETWPSFPYTYTLKDRSGANAVLNDMSVQVTIEYIPLIGGEETARIGVHEDWLQIEKTVSPYDPVDKSYQYTMTITDWYTASVIRIEQIVIDLPSNLTYRLGSTVSEMTTADPGVNGGGPTTPLMLTWDITPPYAMQKPDPHYGPYSVSLSFTLDAPQPVSITGYHMITVTRQDIGTITDYWPFVITAVARNSAGIEQGRIRAGIWHNSDVFIRNWQITP